MKKILLVLAAFICIGTAAQTIRPTLEYTQEFSDRMFSLQLNELRYNIKSGIIIEHDLIDVRLLTGFVYSHNTYGDYQSIPVTLGISKNIFKNDRTPLIVYDFTEEFNLNDNDLFKSCFNSRLGLGYRSNKFYVIAGKTITNSYGTNGDYYFMTFGIDL